MPPDVVATASDDVINELRELARAGFPIIDPAASVDADIGDCPAVAPNGARGEAPCRACPTVTPYCDRGEAPAAPSTGDVSLELLDDMVQLADDGVPVVCPVGLDVASARALVASLRK